MKQYLSLLAFLSVSSASFAQNVPCRPKIVMAHYAYHDDRFPNASQTMIINSKPEILIDNTPGGYWGEVNGGVGCLPDVYKPYNVKTFSYITGGYEETGLNASKGVLADNLRRIDKIAIDKAEGVFLDEVSSSPDAAAKAYLTAIYDRCHEKNLKLIFNPGTQPFDPWLMGLCDYIMTDENYVNRTPTALETTYINRILVISKGISDLNTAVSISQTAINLGFKYTFVSADVNFQQIPSWLNDYFAQITLSPLSPPSISGNQIVNIGETLTLTANGCNGLVNWYDTSTGNTPMHEGQTYVFTPTSSQTVYVSCKALDICESSTRTAVNISVNSCIDNPTIGNLSTSGNFIFKAPNYISAQNTVAPNVSVIYQSGKSIVLNQGFQASTGSTFTAQIGGCNE